ncbi:MULTISPECIES: helix-turn-helix domain-containing protein [Hyphomicrobiales]|uniref:MerR family transcriptional regulator n=1 Tax=Rhodopseudomonas palustris TaxID=1076 RepID=A0A0D7ERU5_RHOPL|nr:MULTISPECIES: helix-turn-helix domain-containing protein [Hyphomicrobiales]KIZ43391.1 MerR family transcriptional regulator [Rhodopseudomonas palustris]MCD1635451.1 helix-turn-helix domain-containing protein [Martelella mediterranea]MDF3814290.1 helix-turn-helix domain-containing protein [Rhodopseudomonas sp. BAL398]WOK17986.1 helix-turn-helix domain-containing protein [Rhodopseudomonas sp. BAL398]|tara:strand:- start:243 stop:650 length:408 start_codon:yes stop_codon:yes gene_type:complete
MRDDGYQIGDLARHTGTKVVTIRYYEKIGLLPEAGRSAGNYRVYGQAELDRLRFIRRCRALGFSLDQVKELVALSSDEERPCAEVDALTREHLDEIERKIADLKSLADQLRRISASCDGATHISNCRIIEALSET